MSTNTIKTIYFTQMEILRSMHMPFSILPYSTLNEKHQIGNIAPPASDYPIIQYLAIGRGGHKNAVGADNFGLVDILEHSATDAALFEQIPFVLVPTNNDISVLERAKYRIRKLENHNGINYYAYYLKVIPIVGLSPDVRVVELSDGEIISDVAYVPSASSLSPTPVNISNTVVNTVEGRHVIVQSKLTLLLDAADITTINDAVTTIYGDIRYSTISEVAIVAGFDKSMTTNLGGSNVTYTEIQTAQIMCFIGTNVPLQQSPDAVELSYGLTNSMPLPPTSII